MTSVAFHFNASDPLQYACRLTRKALRSGVKVAVTAAPHRLKELDRLLWTFEALEFVPHWRGASLAALPATQARTPVVLLERLTAVAGYEVLLNLGNEMPEGFEQFDRVVELVFPDDDARLAARTRWRQYAGRGMTVEGHEVKT